MSSPFPGINPYLETPQLSSESKSRLVFAIADTLNLPIKPPLLMPSVDTKTREQIVKRVLTARKNRSEFLLQMKHYEIAKEIDEDVPTGTDWLMQLLEQLSVEIPTVRQAVLSETTLVRSPDLVGWDPLC